MKANLPPLQLLLSWLGLLVLLGLTVILAYQPLGLINGIAALCIATLKAVVVAAVFMELSERRSLTIAFAGAGFFWLAILFWLVFADYVTRPNFPPLAPAL
jgi:cytochrome c oxidase subunit 4